MLLEEQGFCIAPMTVFEDNMSLISMLKIKEDNNIPKQTKHLNHKYFYIYDRIKEGIIAIKYLSTDEMLADLPIVGKKYSIINS